MGTLTGGTLSRRAALAGLAAAVVSTAGCRQAQASASSGARVTSALRPPVAADRTALTGTARYTSEPTPWGHVVVTDLRTGQHTPLAPNYRRVYAFGSSTIALSGPRFAAEFQGTPYYNGGRGGDTAEETLARLGSHPARGAASRPEHDQRGNILILNLGKNNLNGGGGTKDVGTLLQWTRDAAAWNGGINTLVMGHFVNTYTRRTGSRLRRRATAYNQAARAEFGSQFLDLGGFLTSPAVWGYAGIVPTAADRREQAAGNKPPSLSKDKAHLNPTGETAVARWVHENLAGLGWLRP